jgi:hypothetical protein
MEERKSPIMEFTNDEELMACMREWKKILFLEHWTIKAMLVDAIENEEELCGQNHFVMILNCSLIKIIKPMPLTGEDLRNRMAKFCHEQILVHELLHCKYNWVMETDTYAGKYHDTLDHSLMEQMAKSLIMAKYNLPFEWFENFESN